MSKKSSNKWPKFRKSVVFQAILLGTFTLGATSILSSGDIGTRDAIKLRAEEDLKATIGQVVPQKVHDNDLLKSIITLDGLDGEPITVYQATKAGIVTAVAYSVSGPGYSGEIKTIMGVNQDGKILGVRIVSHTETPGLGDKIEIAKDKWILAFDGLSLGMPPESQWYVKKDGGRFSQFSGATITPRAVVKAVKSGLDFFEQQKEKLLTPVVVENTIIKNTVMKEGAAS